MVNHVKGSPAPQANLAAAACAGVAAVCGLWGVSNPEQARIAAGLGGATAAAAVVFALVTGADSREAKKAAPKVGLGSKPTATTPQLPYPTLWESRWKSQASQQDWEWKGKAKVIDMGEKLVAVTQDDNAKGVYVLELRRQAIDTVAGVWWFYGSEPPSGTFQGRFTDDKTIIQGSWSLSQNGTQSGGEWDLSRIPESIDSDQKEKSQDAGLSQSLT